MAYPIFNNQGSSGNGSAITGNGTFLTLTCPGFLPSALNPIGQATQPMLDFCSYFFAIGAGVTAGLITFQELGADGNFRNMSSPAPINLAGLASTNVNNPFTGPFHGLQIVVTALVGGNITYAELKACVRQGG